MVAIAYLLTFRLVATHLGAVGFAEYALGRRALALLVPIGVLGMDIAIARYLAIAAARNGQSRPQAYTAAGLAISMAGAVMVSILVVSFRGPSAQLVFGDPGHSSLILPLSVLLIGNTLHVVAYADARGRLLMLRAASLMVLNQGLAPLLGVLLGGSVEAMLLITGTLWFMVGLAYLLRAGYSPRIVPAAVRELGRFGVPRVPGDVLQLAIFSGPAMVAANVAGLREAGVIAFVLASLRMIGSVLAPIGFVMLPLAATLLAQGRAQKLRNDLRTLALFTAAILLVMTVLVEVLAQPLLVIYLGRTFAASVGALRLLALAGLPWGLFVVLRSAVDAHYTRPVNAMNTAAAAGLCAVAIGVGAASGRPLLGAEFGFVAAVYLLCGLTLLQITRIRGSKLELEPAVIAGSAAEPEAQVN